MRKLENMSLKKLSVLMVVIMTMMAGTGVAIWEFYASSTFLTEISGYTESPVTYSIEFANRLMDVTNETVVSNLTAELRNDDDTVNMLFVVEVTKQDAGDGCIDYSNDCSNSYYLDGVEIFHNDIVTIEDHSLTDVNAVITCVPFTCPQNISTTLNFTVV